MTDTDELERLRAKKAEELLGADESSDGAENAADEPIHIEDAAHLQSVADTHGTVLADFYADWCGPCKAIEPIVADIAAETEAAVAKVDVDRNQQLAAQYGVRGVPTLVLFHDGEQVEQLVGLQNEAKLNGLIQQYTGA